MEKKDQKQHYKQGSHLPVLIFLSPDAAAAGAVELPRAPGAAKIAEVGERLWSSTQTGWRSVGQRSCSCSSTCAVFPARS